MHSPLLLQSPSKSPWKEKQEISNEGTLQDGVAKVWTEKRRRDRRDRRYFERAQSNNSSCQSLTRPMTATSPCDKCILPCYHQFPLDINMLQGSPKKKAAAAMVKKRLKERVRKEERKKRIQRRNRVRNTIPRSAQTKANDSCLETVKDNNHTARRLSAKQRKVLLTLRAMKSSAPRRALIGCQDESVGSMCHVVRSRMKLISESQ